MSYYGLFNEGGWLESVFDADDPTLPLQQLNDWTGWPTPPTPQSRLRLVNGVRVWQDPRTQDQKAEQARSRRDSLLQACDWVVVKAMEDGVPISTDWVTYRQALRAIPQQGGFPDTITWPIPPETTASVI